MKPDRIVLASGSPRRKQLLEQVGMKFDIIVSDVEEIVTKTLPKDVVVNCLRRRRRQYMTGWKIQRMYLL